MGLVGANPAYHKANDVETISGRILGGSGVATIASPKRGFALTYVSTGVYKITPDTNYPYVCGGSAILMQATNNYNVKISAYTVPPASGAVGTVTFTVTSSGSATDLGSADELWFTLDFSRSQRP
jgi:hypothetical protein